MNFFNSYFMGIMMYLLNEILFVSNILQLFQFEPIFTAAEIQAKKDLAGTSALVFDNLLHHRFYVQPAQ